jgi:hypothetical protein
MRSLLPFHLMSNTVAFPAKRSTLKSDYLITQRRKDEDARELMRQATQYYAKMASQVSDDNLRYSILMKESI